MTQISPQEAQEKKAASPFFFCMADLLKWKCSREKKKNTTEKVRNHQKYVRKTAFFGIPVKEKEKEEQLQHQAKHAKSKDNGKQHVKTLRVR